jgi:ABC-2 type transport system permease protein
MYYLVRWFVRMWRQRHPPAVSVAPVVAVGGAAGGAPRRRAAPAGPSAAARGLPVLIGHQVRWDVITSLRNPRARFATTFFPILLLVVFNGVFGHGHTTVDGHSIELKRFYVPGILALSVVVTSYANLVILVSNLRESGVLKRRRATPASPALLIAGQGIATVVSTLSTGVILLVISKLLYSVGFGGGPILAMAVIVLLGTLAFTCVAYGVSALIGTPEAAQPIVQFTMLPLYFISGVFIPTASLSSGVKTVAKVFPLEHIANTLHLASVNSSFSSSIAVSDVLVLLAWAVGATIFSAWRFSWLPSRASG